MSERKRYGGASVTALAMSEEKKARIAKAIAFALANPGILVKDIAAQFRVPTNPITAARNDERQRLAALKPPRQKVNRLMAWSDGVMVDPKHCKGPKFDRCEGVKA